jgi:hypothetical protein
MLHRVARWYIVKPKIPIWVNLGGPWNGKVWCILRPFWIYQLQPVGTFYDHLEMQWQLGIIFPVLVLSVEKSGNPDAATRDLGVAPNSRKGHFALWHFDYGHFDYGQFVIVRLASRDAGLPGLPWHKIPKWGKLYQITTKLLNDHKIYQWAVIYSKMAKEYTTFSIPRPSKIYPNWDFWFDNIGTIWQPWCDDRMYARWILQRTVIATNLHDDYSR